MPIGKNSINRVAAGLENHDAAPMTLEKAPAAVTVETEKTIVESTAAEPIVEVGEETAATKIEKKIVKSTAKKPAKKKPAKKAEAPAVEEKKAPELVGQAVAAPAAKKRGRKPGSKNKPKAVAPVVKKQEAPKKTEGFTAVAIGTDLPVYLL